MSQEIGSLLGQVIADRDAREARRLPVGSFVRERIESTAEFQARYTSPTWNEKKRQALERQVHRPVFAVRRHREGWMRIASGEREYEVIPKFWEPVT